MPEPNNKNSTRISSFRLSAKWTIGAVFFLILIGGIVRSSGSGMGCPDWPKCFGTWVPPTNLSQLPLDYQERFAVSGKPADTFNAVKTWTEYINRLIGVVIGLLIFLTTIMAYRIRKYNFRIFIFSLVAFLLVAFQGWLGAQVVYSNLTPYIISLHMFLALVIVALLIYALFISGSRQEIGNWPEWLMKHKTWIILCLFLSVLQIFLGTQVRESIDQVSAKLGESRRSEWISNTGIIFYIHRTFSIILLIFNGILIFKSYDLKNPNTLVSRLLVGCGTVILAETAIGIGLTYGGFPAFLQPFHLLFGALLASMQFYLLMGSIMVNQAIRNSESPNFSNAASTI